eukprot:3590632-Rhodomonas_salina.1
MHVLPTPGLPASRANDVSAGHSVNTSAKHARADGTCEEDREAVRDEHVHEVGVLDIVGVGHKEVGAWCSQLRRTPARVRPAQRIPHRPRAPNLWELPLGHNVPPGVPLAVAVQETIHELALAAPTLRHETRCSAPELSDRRKWFHQVGIGKGVREQFLQLGFESGLGF